VLNREQVGRNQQGCCRRATGLPREPERLGWGGKARRSQSEARSSRDTASRPERDRRAGESLMQNRILTRPYRLAEVPRRPASLAVFAQGKGFRLLPFRARGVRRRAGVAGALRVKPGPWPGRCTAESGRRVLIRCFRAGSLVHCSARAGPRGLRPIVCARLRPAGDLEIHGLRAYSQFVWHNQSLCFKGCGAVGVRPRGDFPPSELAG